MYNKSRRPRPQLFLLRSAVNPIGRRFGCGGFVSSRMAERMTLTASSWCWYLRLELIELTGEHDVGGKQAS